MSTTWGVYSLQGKLADGTVVEATDRAAKRWFIRWRVNGAPRTRTFKKKGYANTFCAKLITAKDENWGADERGWPVSPTVQNPAAQSAAAMNTADGHASTASVSRGMTFEQYCDNIWWPNIKGSLEIKNLQGHRRNMELAKEFLRYRPDDFRLHADNRFRVQGSIWLPDVIADDVVHAYSRRRTTNGRTAGVNQRRLDALKADQIDVQLASEEASVATVRAFAVTLGMILRSAHASKLIPHDPMVGTGRYAPKPKAARITERIVASVDDVFDLSEAIAGLGPLGPDGRPLGERFRALVLTGGTAALRPGELAAHRPDGGILRAGSDVLLYVEESETPVYDIQEGIKGRQVNALKHREVGDGREIPLHGAVVDALMLHAERGYGSPTRTFTSVTGCALDWGNLMDVYWRPACKLVFANSNKPYLVQMTPKDLRKAAITFWLDSGITPYLASEWAGHTEDVSKRYYAGRSAASYTREIEQLAHNREQALRRTA